MHDVVAVTVNVEALQVTHRARASGSVEPSERSEVVRPDERLRRLAIAATSRAPWTYQARSRSSAGAYGPLSMT